MPFVLALVLSAAPVRLVQSVQGVPVGVVEVEVKAGVLTYRARHVFRDEARAFETSWPVDAAGRDAAGLSSEVLALSVRSAPGCREVREERTGRRERLCLDAEGRGSLDEVKLRAAWDARGRLTWLELLDGAGLVVSRFDRSAAEPKPGRDPFVDGFPVTGDGPAVRLQPAAGATQVVVEGVSAEAVNEGTCLSAARAWVSAHAGDVVQLGVVVEAGRAWPHAWVRRASGTFVDPTLDAASAARSARHYLAFPDDVAGALYLELASGSRRVARSSR